MTRIMFWMLVAGLFHALEREINKDLDQVER